jgi:hypothetical protein
MPNVVKYQSGGSETHSIKKGNLWFGVGGRGYGPTDTTGFYSGIEIPDGGYAFYQGSAGGFTYYTANNDDQLVALVNSATGNSFDISESLHYIAQQDGMAVMKKNENQIVTDGLVFNVEASSLLSYPTTGSVWYDISRNNNTGSLENDPSFNDGGWFDFDGTDVKIKFDNPPELNFTSSMSHEVWFWRNSNATTNLRLTSKGAGGTGENQQGFGFFGSDTSLAWSVNVDGSRTNISSPISIGEWYQVVGTVNLDTGDQKIYLNGELKNSTTFGGSSTMESNIDFYIGSYFSPSNPLNWDGKIGPVRAYSKALSPTEVKQNYYGGPIVTDGLVLAVDAGNLVSYESGSTTTYSMTGSLSGLLENGLGFISNNGGIWRFDGTDDGIDCGNVLADLVDLSLECWVKFGQQDSDYNGIISKTLNNSDGWELRTMNYNSTQTRVQFRYKGDNAATSGVWFDNGVWYHIMATGESGAQKFYVNGTLTSSAANQTTPNPNSNSLRIGTLAYATHLRLTGDIGVARIYNKALTAEEVWQNYLAQSIRFE